jgi:branched-chain amino acid transport system permease protein
VTLVAGIVVGLVNALITPILSISEYRDMTPFVLAIVALLWLSRHREISFSRSAG